MYALRERRQHVTQEDFEFAIAKVRFRILVIQMANVILAVILREAHH
jgi:ATP-dependent 26S proteasome regulatory subunit